MIGKFYAHHGDMAGTCRLLLGSLAILLTVFPGSARCGTIYRCSDRNGATILTDNPSVRGYSCEPLESYKDITDQDREAWANENRQKLKEAETGEIKEREASREKQNGKKDDRKRGADVRGQADGVR
jgi:hypothetical protein